MVNIPENNTNECQNRSTVSQLPPDSSMLKQAVELARSNMLSGIGGPFGAIIVKGGKVIAKAGNEVESTNDPTAHAEVVAIRRACRSLGSFHLQGCVLYSSCEPCPMCLAAAYWAHVDGIYYAADRDDAARAGFDDEFLYRQVALEPKERDLHMKQVARLQPLARGVFAQWVAMEDKIQY